MGNDYDSNPFDGEDLRAKEKHLEAMEAELNKREEELKKKEDAVTRNVFVVEKKNWPPSLPVIHHDIPNDIPLHLQRTQYVAFATLLGIVGCLVWNFVAITVSWFKGEALEILLLSVIYLIIGIPGAYVSWYRPLYRAMRTNGALMFGFYFLSYGCHLFFCVYSSISPPMIFKGKSLTGILPAVDILPRDGVVGCLYMIGFTFFALETLISIWVIQEVFRYFRSSGKMVEAKRDARRSTMMVALGHG